MELPQRQCGNSSCPQLLDDWDTHDYCFICLGFTHADDAVYEQDPRCLECANLHPSDLRSRLNRAQRYFLPPRALYDEREVFDDDRRRFSSRRSEDRTAGWEDVTRRPRPRASAAAGSARALEPPERLRSSYREGGSMPIVQAPRSRSPARGYYRSNEPRVAPPLTPPGERYGGVRRRAASRYSPPPGTDPSDGDDEDEGEALTSYQTRRCDDDDERGYRVVDEVEGDGDVVRHDARATADQRPPLPALGPPQTGAPRLDATPAADGEAATVQADAVPPPADPPKGETTLLELYKIATARCGLKWPGDEDEEAPATTSEWQGLDSVEEKIAKRSKLPLAKGFGAGLASSWDAPVAPDADPKKMRFNIDCVGTAELGLAAFPPMDSTLATSLLRSQVKGQKAPFSINKDVPCFTNEKDVAGSVATKAVYKATASGARALNAAALLQGSLKVLLAEAGDAPTPQQLAEMRRLTQEIILLNKYSTEWAGRVLGLCVIHERARWLDHVTFNGANDRKNLQNLKVTPENLFQGAMGYLQDSHAARKAQDGAALSCIQAPSKPPPPKPQSRPADRGRPENRNVRPAQASSAPPAARTERRDRKYDDRSRPPPDKPHYRGPNRGRGSKRGK